MRYAIYFIPDPSSALWAFGTSVIGYDSAAVTDVPQPTHPMFRQPAGLAMTEAPRRYGFHATLKAPFALRDGATCDALLGAAQKWAATADAVPIGRLEVAALGAFLALIPVEQPTALTDFAGQVVEAFEPFRADLSPEDRARRLQSKLTSTQVAHLDRWGYPYVFDDYRFHMTLTGALRGDQLETSKAALSGLYHAICTPVTLDAIAVCHQPTRADRFSVLRRFPLRPQP